MTTANTATERLLRVLDLEERQGWRNKAVMKGLQEMAPRWAEQARGEGVPAGVVARVEELMLNYGKRALPDRADTIATLRKVLAGDLEAAEAPPKEQQAPPQAQPQRKAAAPAQAARATRSASVAAAEGVPSTLESAGDAGEPDASMGGFGSTYVFEFDDPEPAPEPATLPEKRASGRAPRRPEELDGPVRALFGVGEAAAEQLGRLGIRTPRDLLFHFPARHEDYSKLRTIADLVVGETTTVVANLWQVQEKSLGSTRTRVEATLGDGTGTLRATFWNQRWMVRKLQPLIGKTLRLSGKVGAFGGSRTLDNPAFEPEENETLATGRIMPVYPTTEGLSQEKLRQFTRTALDEFVAFMEDPLPADILVRDELPELQTALRQFHFPETIAQRESARRRFAFEELFYVQLGVLRRRDQLKGATAPALPNGRLLLEPFIGGLPFALTGAQLRVLDEIAADLAESRPMTRMVQGDVGSGKTAVAAGAMWIAAANGAQSAMLAPTQILAEQHYRGLERLLAGVSRPDGSALQVALLTGRVTGGERERILAGLRAGEIDVVVGTTALIQQGVDFGALGLVVVDEQHRFGVEQRGALRNQAGQQPHLLAMSATPIPRSLALTIFGDLDLSILDEMPPGRLPVKTVIFRPFERERVYAFLEREAAAGRQAFIVYPLVEESEALEAGAATQEYERLAGEVFPGLRVALLHGQMKGAEKDAVMSAFAAGDFDILVATTVIEVGIDVPNASVIIIEDAERFGLAQLHQLRGRVGRGGQPSFCVLVTRAEGDGAESRLRVLEETNNGFVLAEEDLRRRGPGEFLGTRQTGLPDLQVAHFSDLATVEKARKAAQRFFEQDPQLERHAGIRARVEKFWRGEGDIS